ncbi:MAG TPA: hypothetical protein DCK76_07365 [Desulfotomaculum sp.]|nr:MAG: Uncharacterized protein XD78_1358 [Desulfotomaculum sp. 46_296]HAG11184.1 hypothetical protein [Desulfotomaculum sp.]HBY03146.1 hypothetical protein [Desulfotomaculum sp.]
MPDGNSEKEDHFKKQKDFVNVYTVTNFSDTPFLAQIWFNTKPPGKGVVSDEVSPGNNTLTHLPVPEIKLQYVQSVRGFPI